MGLGTDINFDILNVYGGSVCAVLTWSGGANELIYLTKNYLCSVSQSVGQSVDNCLPSISHRSKLDGDTADRDEASLETDTVSILRQIYVKYIHSPGSCPRSRRGWHHKHRPSQSRRR